MSEVFAQIQPAETHENVVRGTVVNSVTNQPVSRSLVYTVDHRFATLTDGEGHFEFAMPDTGSQSQSAMGRVEVMRFPGRFGRSSIRARKPGFLDDPGQRMQFETASQNDLTITLVPEAVVKGRVTLSSPDVAAGAIVQIFSWLVQDGLPRWIPGATARTNSNGEFRFAELHPGAYKLITHEFMDNDPVAAIPGTQACGFPPVYYPNTTDFAAASTIQLTAGQTYEAEFSLTGHPYFPVKIPVANAEANGGMNIVVSLRGNGGPGYSLGYNAQKQTIEGTLPNGNYKVEAITFGPNSITGQVNLTVAGAPVEGTSLVLTRSSSVTLKVTEEFTSNDLSGSSVWTVRNRSFQVRGPRAYLQASLDPANDFDQDRGGTLRMPTGPNDDALVFENLHPGRYWLRLSSSRGYIAAASMGAVDLLHQPLVIGPGSTVPIEIRMRDDGAQLEGTIAGFSPPPPDGAASSGYWASPAWVYCVPLPDSAGQFQQLAVSSSGTFNSQMMAPGTYRLLAFKNQQGSLPYRDPEAMKSYEGKGHTVHLSAGQKSTVQVQIISGDE